MLHDFLTRYPPYCQYMESWPIQGQMVVQLGLSDVLPPEFVRSSIMSILVGADAALYYIQPMGVMDDIAHVLIGGRPEPGETYQQAIIREAAEETGAVITPLAIVGYRHFHQVEPRAPATDRPYPDFIQPILLSRVSHIDPALIIANDALPGSFVNLALAIQQILPAQRLILMQVEAYLARKGTDQ